MQNLAHKLAQLAKKQNASQTPPIMAISNKDIFNDIGEILSNIHQLKNEISEKDLKTFVQSQDYRNILNKITKQSHSILKTTLDLSLAKAENLRYLGMQNIEALQKTQKIATELFNYLKEIMPQETEQIINQKIDDLIPANLNTKTSEELQSIQMELQKLPLTEKSAAKLQEIENLIQKKEQQPQESAKQEQEKEEEQQQEESTHYQPLPPESHPKQD